ncbi:MAG: ComEC/Rec2 family competence protein, partial [Prochlorothrix sp.]
VTGSLYVTVPLLQGTGLQPGQTLTVTGNLYLPRSPNNPGGFDFRAYLLRRGAFAGLSAWRVTQVSPAPPWQSFVWSLRQRMVQAQSWGSVSPTAPLISAMALGRKAVDLPFDVQDAFARIGLAHTIAASGFHVSLVVGAILALVRKGSPRLQFGLGLGVLLLFLGLTGAQPSILRAVIMGGVALGGLVWEQKVKPLGLLLCTAIALLLVQPLWIEDLGFQLSFLATFGLLVSAQPLANACDRLPPTLANAVAVPLAATLWTLPLQLFHFGLFSPYTILVNLVTLPFVYLLSLGGISSAAIAALWPQGGTLLVRLLHYPAQGFWAVVQGFNQLPGATIAVGNLAIAQVILLYGLMVFWWLKKPKIRWASAIAVLMLGLALVPGWYQRYTWDQLTILRGDRLPVAVIQHQGQVGVINSGSGDQVGYNLLPFLRQQGVNRLDWAVSTDRSPDAYAAWTQLLAEIPITQFVDAVAQPVPQSGSQSGSQSTSQPGSQAASQPGSQSTSQPVPQAGSRPASQPVPQAGSRPASQPGSQSVSRPASPPSPSVPSGEAQWLHGALQEALNHQQGRYQALTDRPLALAPLALESLPGSAPPDLAIATVASNPGHAWIWTWADQTWVVLLDCPIDRQTALLPALTALNVPKKPWLWWHSSGSSRPNSSSSNPNHRNPDSGDRGLASPIGLSRDLITQVPWQGAIVTGTVPDATRVLIQQQGIPLYGADQPGALRWTATGAGSIVLASPANAEGEPSFAESSP